MSDLINVLLEMGFTRKKAEKALKETNNQGIENAMEWLIAHNDDIEVEEPAVEPTSGDALDPGAFEKEKSPSPEVKSYKCLDCNKMFKSDVELEYHAVKSGHQNFAESTESVRPLSEEEKAEKRRELQIRIKIRRMEREEKERLEAIEQEKSRRKTGQELAMAKQKMEEEEMRRLAAEKRREKMEDKLARQQVLDAIERDKQARREKFGTVPKGSLVTATEIKQEPLANAPSESIPLKPSEPRKTYNQCRLQIRLTNGQTLTQSFGPHEELAAVRLFVQLNRTDGTNSFSFMTNYPKKVFSEDDMAKPLEALGLVPSAVLIVKQQ